MWTQRAKSLASLLATQGISHPAVLKAIEKTPRHLFVSRDLASVAYDNTALPLSKGQTISQPVVVAAMTQAALGTRDKLHRVLEIGTGSGYQAAILSRVADEVYSVERISSLYEHAKAVLQHDENITLKLGDGNLGWEACAPFDAILVTAAADTVPPALKDQLSRKGGRLIIPLGDRWHQTLKVIVREEDRFSEAALEAVIFVPLLKGIE